MTDVPLSRHRPSLILARSAVFVAPSAIQGLGIFAAENIPARRIVIEYTGEWITQAQARGRLMRPRCTLFEWDDDWVIDAANGGSGAEYANHSCDPNLRFYCRHRRVYLASTRPIAEGEELTIDYKLVDADIQPCCCGSPTCRGSINAPPE